MISDPLKIRSIAVSAAGVAALVGILLASAPFLRIVDNALRDGMVSTISPWTQPPADIVLVTITEDTLARFAYRSPVDREFLADVLVAILAAGPAAVGLDFLFDQPTEQTKDDKLLQVLAKADRPVIVAHAGVESGLTDKQVRYLAHFTNGLLPGSVDLPQSPVDGTVRGLSTGLEHNDGKIPGFAARIAATAGVVTPRVGSPPLPMTYYRTSGGAPYAFKQYPAEAVEHIPAEWFKDKFVLIGVDLPDNDRHRTPFHLLNGPTIGNMPGIAIHAHGLAQLLKGDRLVPLGLWWQFLVAVVLCSVALAVTQLSLHPVLRLALLVGLCVILWAAAMVMFHQTGTLLPLSGPTLAVMMSSGIAFTYVWYRDRKQRMFIAKAFSRYVSPAYVDRLIAHPDELNLGGQRREVSYIFTDVAGFTSLSERTEPAVLSKLLNEYLDGLCGLFLAHDVTIDKIIGDAVVGFAGAPVDQPDHAAKTVQLMLAIDQVQRTVPARPEIEWGTILAKPVSAYTQG